MRPDPPFWSDCDGGFLVFVVVHNWQFCRGLGARQGPPCTRPARREELCSRGPVLDRGGPP